MVNPMLTGLLSVSEAVNLTLFKNSQLCAHSFFETREFDSLAKRLLSFSTAFSKGKFSPFSALPFFISGGC